MKNSDYWRQRAEILEAAKNSSATKYTAEIEKQFRAAQKTLDEQIEQWYGRFAKNNQISLADARQWLTGKDLAEFKWDVNEYIKYGKEAMIDPVFIKQLENASARFHVSKLEALKLKTQNTVEQLYGQINQGSSGVFAQIYQNAYYHTAYQLQQGVNIGWDIAALNPHQIESVLSKPWTLDGRTFSDRIWLDKNGLLNEAHTQITQNLILGKAPDDAIKAISKKFNTSKSNAGRLVMTESAYFANEAQINAYKTLDVEEFEVVGTLDSTTCSKCGGFDGTHLPMAQYEAGVTAPPFHAWCRCCTAPYFDDDEGERFARGEDGDVYYVPSDMKYDEWKDKFVDGGDKGDLRQNGVIVNIPDFLHGDYTDFISLTLTPAENDVLMDLYNLTKETGHEYGNTIVNGVCGEPFTSSLPNKIKIPRDRILGSIYHSHTNATPLSMEDFRMLLHNVVDKVGVVGYNGDVFTVVIGDGIMPEYAEFDAVANKIKHESMYSIIDDDRFIDWTESERVYMSIREQAILLARHFKWVMEGGNIFE